MIIKKKTAIDYMRSMKILKFCFILSPSFIIWIISVEAMKQHKKQFGFEKPYFNILVKAGLYKV